MAHQTLKQDSKVKSHPRDYPIFRPYPEECPETLLGLIPDTEFDLDCIRIMRDEDLIIAAYRFSEIDRACYRIHSLVVDSAYRRQGIGSWMLAHVLGIVESKGGQFVYTNPQKSRRFFQDRGFKTTTSGELKFTVIHE